MRSQSSRCHGYICRSPARISGIEHLPVFIEPLGNKINENLNNDTSLNDNKLVYVMDEKYDVDIDEMLDLQIAELAITAI